MLSAAIVIGTLTLSMTCNISADDILKYYSHFSHKTGSDVSSKLSPKEKNINLSAAEFAQERVKVKGLNKSYQV